MLFSTAKSSRLQEQSRLLPKQEQGWMTMNMMIPDFCNKVKGQSARWGMIAIHTVPTMTIPY
jgi:hypothetical protein